MAAFHAENLTLMGDTSNSATPAQYKWNRREENSKHDNPRRCRPKHGTRDALSERKRHLTSRQAEVLAALWDSHVAELRGERPLTQRDIAADLGITQQRVCRIVDDLRRKGVALPVRGAV